MIVSKETYLKKLIFSFDEGFFQDEEADLFGLQPHQESLFKHRLVRIVPLVFG